jgi:hypothetical protein
MNGLCALRNFNSWVPKNTNGRHSVMSYVCLVQQLVGRIQGGVMTL